MSNFNAMPRPATVLVTGERACVVRQRETETDVFRRDVIPDHLAKGEGRDKDKDKDKDRNGESGAVKARNRVA